MEDFDISCAPRSSRAHPEQGKLTQSDFTDHHKNPYTYLANGWVDGEEDFAYTRPETALDPLPWTRYLSAAAQ